MSLEETLVALGLEGARFAIAKKVGGAFSASVWEDCEESRAGADAWLSDASDAWITGNPIGDMPIPSGRPSADQVAEVRWLLLDCDPCKTQIDPDGLSEASRDAAHALAAEAWEAIGGAGILVDSGRGAQLWIRVTGDVPRRAFIRYIASELSRIGVKVDATHDPSRLMRLPGYANSRTGRVAMVVASCEGEPITADEARDFIGDWEETRTETDALESFDADPPSAADRDAWLRDVAGGIWWGEAEGDRSMRDFLFVRALLSADCPEATACRLLYSLPGGKASEDRRGPRYWAATLESVYRTLAEERARRARLSTLVAETGEDAGAPFVAQALEDLAWYRRCDPPAWQRMRVAFKALRAFKMSDLENAINEVATQSLGPPDDIARCVKRNGKQVLWLIREDDGGWLRVPVDSVSAMLEGPDGRVLKKAAIANPWLWDSEPFQPQWLEGRRYNSSTAQWRIKPAPGEYPMWEQMLTVIGRGLDEAVLEDDWCIKNGITTGAEYLFAWICALAQHPEQACAYLFCYSDKQNTGKSILHEAISKHLLSGGVIEADKALLSERGFNSELAGAVLCIVEETNLGRQRSQVYERIKAYVTSSHFACEGKGLEVARAKNFTHWYQTANLASFCPIFSGDTRVTAWEMMPLLEEEKMDIWEIHRRLSLEAPAFLDAILSWPVPEGGDRRLRVPALGTAVKTWQEEANQSLLAVWVEENPAWVAMSKDEIVSAVQRYVTARGEELRHWKRSPILRKLPSGAPVARLRQFASKLKGLQSETGSARVGIKWQGQMGFLATATDETAVGVGKLVAELERRGVTWVSRKKSNGVRVVRVGYAGSEATL